MSKHTSFIDEFNTINPHQLWLLPLLDIHQAFGKDTPNTPLYEWLNDYFDKNKLTLTNHQNYPLTFTHQNDLEHGISYEVHIDKHKQIPTRDNLHDWFGACIWSIFPKSKAVLNAKHLEHIHDDHSGNKRNRVRDTITVFDENGAILVVADDDIGRNIGTALANFDWQNCLVRHRAYWSDNEGKDKKAKVFIFGHALLEQLINPYKSLCSHTLIIHVPPAFFDSTLTEQLTHLDEVLSVYLQNFLKEGVTPRALNPLPILGVPYFWQNDDPKFYDDPFVFRGGRRQ